MDTDYKASSVARVVAGMRSRQLAREATSPPSIKKKPPYYENAVANEAATDVLSRAGRAAERAVFTAVKGRDYVNSRLREVNGHSRYRMEKKFKSVVFKKQPRPRDVFDR
jgi:hypothetical protein